MKKTVPAASPIDSPVRRLDPELAFNRWRDLQPYGGATDRERQAFLAGFKAATEPLAPTKAELDERLKNLFKEQQEKEDARRAALPAGVCPECEGEGEQGGQFCGYWKCESCSGTGKTPNAMYTAKPAL